MRVSVKGARFVIASGLLLGASVVFADDTRFSDFTPLTSSAGPTTDESAPITFGNPDFQQRSIADRESQLAAGAPNSGSWDMNTAERDRPSQGSLPVHRLRDWTVGRAAS